MSVLVSQIYCYRFSRTASAETVIMKHAFGLDLTIRQTVDDAVDLDSTALIIYDMQVGIMRQLKDGGEMLTKVATVLEVAREVGLRTFFLRHTSLPKNLMGVSQLRHALA